MIEIVREIETVHREIGDGQPPGARAIRLRRDYDAPIEDVWDAVTNPERISRWFLPISGNYRVGGRYQMEDNAGGDILECTRPHGFKVTWGYGAATGEVDGSVLQVRLSTLDSGATRLELEHTAVVPEEPWAQFGPGAVGVGWDLALIGLTVHLRGDGPDDPTGWQGSDEGRGFAARASEAWGVANRAAGADDETVALGVANTNSIYAPVPDAQS